MTNNDIKVRLRARVISAAIILFVAVAPIIYAFWNLSWSNFKFDIFTIGVPICYFIAVICIVLSVFGVKGPEIISESKLRKIQRNDKDQIKNNLIIFSAIFQIYGFLYLMCFYKYLYVKKIIIYCILLFVAAIILLQLSKYNKLINTIKKIHGKIIKNKLLLFLTKEF